MTKSHNDIGGRAPIWILVCLLPGWLRAGIAIKPAVVEVDLDKGRPSGTFLISNVGDTEERFRINASHFTYTEAGALRQSPTGDFSLAPWIHFNPRELTLAPKTQRTVRFAIVPRGKLVEGEWWAAMELESLAVSDIVKEDVKTGRTAKLKAVTRLLVPIFGTVGRPSYEGQVKEIRAETERGTVMLKALVAATGTGRLRVDGDYEISDPTGKVIDGGPFAIGYVLRGGQRWFAKNIEAAIPNGDYTVRIALKAPHVEQPILGRAKVTWPEAPVPDILEAVGPPGLPAAADDKQNQPQPPKEGNEQTEVQGSTDSR